MRIVSALYGEFGPFEFLNKVTNKGVANNIKELTKDDILLTHGGADIHPSLYGKETGKKSGVGNSPSPRDVIEWNLIQKAIDLDIPIIGICRGAQMLCAAAGGYLMQHVNHHGMSRGHEVITYNGEKFLTNTVHHQMMVPDKAKHELLAQIPPDKLLSDVYFDVDEKVDHNQEPEFIYFNDIKGFAIQWHPEWMPFASRATHFVLEEIEKRYEY